MKRWTNEKRGRALRAGGRLNGYNIRQGWPHVNMLESAVHELAHVVCLHMPVPPKGHLSTIVSHMLDKESSRWCAWQEILALAAEVVVLRKLGLPLVARWAVEGAAFREDTAFSYNTFVRLVARARKTKATKRRARRLRALLDRFCEEGQRSL